KITGCSSIQRVFRSSIKAEFFSNRLRVQLQRGPCQRARTIRRNSQTLIQVFQTVNIAKQWLRMREQRMRQQNRLCRLRVRLTRHDGLWMLFSLAGDSFYQVRNLQRDITDGITHPHAEQGCHLVIAGTPRTQTTAYFRTNDVNRSEEHTSELQSRFDLVCRLLLEKKNKTNSA